MGALPASPGAHIIGSLYDKALPMTKLATDPSTKAKLFRGLSDPSRLSILEALRGGALSVGEIVDATRLSQPNTSNHLSCLLDCGLVSRRQEGRFAFYELSDDRVDELLERAEALLTDVAHGVQSCRRYGSA